MARATGRTRPCSPATISGRRAKALEFWQSACEIDELHPDDHTDSFIQMCVLAGIAAADVICCTRLGEHSDDQSHNGARKLLERVDKQLAGHLGTLLDQKTSSGYRERPSTAKQRVAIRRAAESLVEAARATR